MSWITCNLFFLISCLFSIDIESLPFACTDVQPSNFKAFFGNGVELKQSVDCGFCADQNT